MRFERELYSEYLSQSEVSQALKVTIDELKRLLKEAEDFEKKFSASSLQDGDSYCDFSIVCEEGYDRTGPTHITVVP